MFELFGCIIVLVYDEYYELSMTSLECCYNKKQVEEFVWMFIVVAAFGSVENSFQILNRFFLVFDILVLEDKTRD